MKLLAKWFVVALSFLGTAYLVPGIEVSSFYTALVLALVWGVIVGFIVRPILLVLTLPVNIITFGLFTFILNGFLFWLLGTVVKGFHVSGFFTAVVGAFVVTVLSWIGNKLVTRVSA